jgi:hypothetical protein
MSSEIMHQMLETIEAEVNSRPAPSEFEMADQARVAIDRIRFAIKHTEEFCPRSEHARGALQRLENIDRRFQQRSRRSSGLPHATGGPVNGTAVPGERKAAPDPRRRNTVNE